MIKRKYLCDRAEMLRAARAFFRERNVLEVDCPALGRAAPIDLHIEVMQVRLEEDQVGYLHTSPEYGMKRLLSCGSGDIYQISHVFRQGEVGPLHNPEFTMAEWYRCGFSLEEMIEETLAFVRLFLSAIPSSQITYRDAFQHYLQLDYVNATVHTLLAVAEQHDLVVPTQEAASWDKDTLLQLLMGFLIEPHLGKDTLCVLRNFPATQAALSQTTVLASQESIAYRFEVYFHGMELANGYRELLDAVEQRRRFEETNAERQKQGKKALKIDEKLLDALGNGLPDCCGVAAGFDRLMLLRHAQQSLCSVLPFSWAEV